MGPDVQLPLFGKARLRSRVGNVLSPNGGTDPRRPIDPQGLLTTEYPPAPPLRLHWPITRQRAGGTKVGFPLKPAVEIVERWMTAEGRTETYKVAAPPTKYGLAPRTAA